ncbi:MAG: bifunctional nuclease family protein [Burkholderiales bacterium]|nr:bifunctional nuclease family protein [Burkholderiales bacterium]
MNELHALLCAAALLAGVGLADAARAQALPPEARTPAQVSVKEVRVVATEAGPVVLLLAEGRAIPVFVDPTVAGSIQGALSGQKTLRPLSHDLMRDILQQAGARVTQAVIPLKDGIYYGALSVRIRDEVKVFDARSSDSIALAIHFKAPILVGRDLLESAGLPLSPGAISM